MISFCLGEGEPLPDFHLRALAIRSEIVLMRDLKGWIKKLTVKYNMELPNMKHLQSYMTSFEIYFRRFEGHPQSEQLSIIFNPSMELKFETLETSYIDMNPSNSIIEPIVKRNFGNTFHHHNGPNQRQYTNKNASQQYHYTTTRKQYQHINNGQQNQHINHIEHYQPRSFQRHITSSISHLKENCLGCGLNNKGVR